MNFRQNLEDAEPGAVNDSIVISEDGKPVAALVDVGLLARIRRRLEHFDVLSRRICDAYARAPAGEGLVEIDAAVLAGRKAR
ncbi:prevent-host-death protein [Burkholderia cepacia]|uniref:prevent-host-death protein n=1 Tax=Burkholderia cepacia TaxID=292 RepID=UPI002AB71706|nr:prevent-host-death protein [Burkholderia cepacia]